jgi:hypothetical protein
MLIRELLWPTVVLALVIYAVWLTMFVRRFAHMKANPPRPDDFATTDKAMRYFEPVEMPANNLRNLFEMPVLFFALVPLLIVTQSATFIQVVLAWAYVLLRAAHSFIHVGRNVVIARFMAYAASCAVLSAMWIGFVVDVLLRS